jgi:peptidoglycan/xylan/chitin deacetylase (PgdA/CDA1 family)
MGHKPQDMSGLYSYLHEESELRLEEAERVGYGFDLPKVVAIHFDDGWNSELEAVPILNRFGFEASFWIIAGKGIGWPHLDWDKIQALAENPNFDIFSHTMSILGSRTTRS